MGSYKIMYKNNYYQLVSHFFKFLLYFFRKLKNKKILQNNYSSDINSINFQK